MRIHGLPSLPGAVDTLLLAGSHIAKPFYLFKKSWKSTGPCRQCTEGASCLDDLECNDGNPCTDDRCLENQCTFVAHSEVKECDNRECTVNDRCDEGVCISGEEEECDEPEPEPEPGPDPSNPDESMSIDDSTEVNDSESMDDDDDDSFGRSRMGCQSATSDHRGQWSWLAILISALIFQRRRLSLSTTGSS
jgi:hypothetical protein